MDSVSHTLFKEVVSRELTKYFRHNGGGIASETINSLIDEYMRYEEADPIDTRRDEDYIYSLGFNIFGNLTQRVGGVEWQVEDSVSREIATMIDKEAMRDRLRRDGVEEDLLGVIDI